MLLRRVAHSSGDSLPSQTFQILHLVVRRSCLPASEDDTRPPNGRVRVMDIAREVRARGARSYSGLAATAGEPIRSLERVSAAGGSSATGATRKRTDDDSTK